MHAGTGRRTQMAEFIDIFCSNNGIRECSPKTFVTIFSFSEHYFHRIPCPSLATITNSKSISANSKITPPLHHTSAGNQFATWGVQSHGKHFKLHAAQAIKNHGLTPCTWMSIC